MDLNTHVCSLTDHSLWLSGSHSVVRTSNISIQLEIVRNAHSQAHLKPAESETGGGSSHLSAAL